VKLKALKCINFLESKECFEDVNEIKTNKCYHSACWSKMTSHGWQGISTGVPPNIKVKKAEELTCLSKNLEPG
jgi:hypothetical protein